MRKLSTHGGDEDGIALVPRAPGDVERGDIIQISDTSHAWYPALLFVDEAKAWGVQAGVIVPVRNDTAGSVSVAYNRLRFGQFVLVGRAEVVPG